MQRGESFQSLYMDNSANSWLVEIDDYYLQSAVSYYGLSSYVPHYNKACSILKGRQVDTSEMTKRSIETLADSCRLLYGLLHQRFVITEDGIRRLHSKYSRGVYGKCPRVCCKSHNLIPFGFSLKPGTDKAKLWCPLCHDIYDAKDDIDGAFFGPDLPIMFHKISDIPTRFRAFNTFINSRTKDDDGNELPQIQQRLYRWGEKKPEQKICK